MAINGEKTNREHPLGGFCRAMKLLIRTAKNWQGTHAEAESGDETDGDLQTRVREINEQEETIRPPAKPDRQHAINCQQPCCGLRESVDFCQRRRS